MQVATREERPNFRDRIFGTEFAVRCALRAIRDSVRCGRQAIRGCDRIRTEFGVPPCRPNSLTEFGPNSEFGTTLYVYPCVYLLRVQLLSVKFLLRRSRDRARERGSILRRFRDVSRADDRSRAQRAHGQRARAAGSTEDSDRIRTEFGHRPSRPNSDRISGFGSVLEPARRSADSVCRDGRPNSVRIDFRDSVATLWLQPPILQQTHAHCQAVRAPPASPSHPNS